MAEKEKYAIINHNRLTKLFTDSCVSQQATRLHKVDLGKCSLIKSRHFGNGRDRLLIVQNRGGPHKDNAVSSKTACVVVTPITQITEQARSSLQKEGGGRLFPENA